MFSWNISYLYFCRVLIKHCLSRAFEISVGRRRFGLVLMHWFASNIIIDRRENRFEEIPLFSWNLFEPCLWVAISIRANCCRDLIVEYHCWLSKQLIRLFSYKNITLCIKKWHKLELVGSTYNVWVKCPSLECYKGC